jgi:hypothetical protein
MPVVKRKKDDLENRGHKVTVAVQPGTWSIVAKVLPACAKKASIIGTFPDENGFYPGGEGIIIRREE